MMDSMVVEAFSFWRKYFLHNPAFLIPTVLAPKLFTLDVVD